MSKTVSKPQAVADLESSLLRVVCSREAVSRIELARELKLVPSTAGIYVDRLIQSGFLLEAPATTRTLGRPPVLLKLNPQGGRFIGVDFDARQIMTVAVDFAQRPLEQVSRTIPARATAESILELIEESITEVAGSRRRNLLGIGLGVPGPVDPLHGISRHYPFIPGWHDVPIGPRIAARFSVPVFVENNLRSMALGELWCGEGRGLRDLVCLGIRSGIGSGIVIQGQLLQGAHNLAGEIGRWTWPGESTTPEVQDAPLATTKNPRTIEDVASLTAILSEAARRIDTGEKTTLGKPGEQPTVADLLAASRSDDQLALDLLTEAAQVHAWIAHQLVQILDPERIIVAGPLVESEAYLQTLQQAATQLGGPGFSDRIARSTLGAYAGRFGGGRVGLSPLEATAMTPDHLLPAIVIISLAGFAQGLSGFGFGMIAMGLLPIWMDLNEAQAIATLAGLAGCVAMTGMTVTHVRWANVGHLWIASTLGIPFGFWVLKALPESVLLRLLGFTICVLVRFEITARRRSASEKSHWNVWLIGLASGALSGAFNIGGPPLVVYLFSQPWSKEQQVATLSTVFISSGVMRMILLAFNGDLSPVTWETTAWSIGPMLLAIYLGNYSLRFVPQRHLRFGIYCVLLSVGLCYLIFGQIPQFQSNSAISTT